MQPGRKQRAGSFLSTVRKETRQRIGGNLAEGSEEEREGNVN